MKTVGKPNSASIEPIPPEKISKAFNDHMECLSALAGGAPVIIQRAAIQRFATHEEANASMDEAIARGMAYLAAKRRAGERP